MKFICNIYFRTRILLTTVHMEYGYGLEENLIQKKDEKRCGMHL